MVIDREAFLNLIDQMRISVPEETRRSHELEAERERYMARVQEDARAILEQAHEDAARLLDEQEIRQQAELDARRILERARREARETRAGADAYAAQVLGELDRRVQQIARTIHNGLRELGTLRQAEEAASAEPPEAPAAVPEASTPGAAAARGVAVHSPGGKAVEAHEPAMPPLADDLSPNGEDEAT